MSALPPATHSLNIRSTPRSAYLSLMINAMHQALAYRSRIILSMLGNGIWIVVVYYLWRSVYTAQSQVMGYSWDSMRTYLVLAYALNVLISFGSTTRLYNLVRTGEIAQELLRPVNYLGQQLVITLGAALIEGLLSAILALGLGIILVGILPPASLPAALLFLPSIMLGFLIKFLISFLFSLLCFWTINGIGLVWAQMALVNLFSGALVPLVFLPGWLGQLAAWAPFQGIIATPLAIYQGSVVGWDMLRALVVQLLWVLTLWALTGLIWRPAIRALDIQGG